MRNWLVTVLLLVGVAAYAQDSDYDYFRRSFSLEAGAGFMPIHNLLTNTDPIDRSLASVGQTTDNKSTVALSITGVFNCSPKWSIALKCGVSWFNCDVIQYPVFGIDPSDKPRYLLDYNQAEKIDRISTSWSWTTTLMFRHIWNPPNVIQTYSEIGLGAIFGNADRTYLLPGITPVGIRICFSHFYLYAENTFSPIATMFHGGVGWKF